MKMTVKEKKMGRNTYRITAKNHCNKYKTSALTRTILHLKLYHKKQGKKRTENT
jgi:hypothetical protein